MAILSGRENTEQKKEENGWGTMRVELHIDPTVKQSGAVITAPAVRTPQILIAVRLFTFTHEQGENSRIGSLSVSQLPGSLSQRHSRYSSTVGLLL